MCSIFADVHAGDTVPLRADVDTCVRQLWVDDGSDTSTTATAIIVQGSTIDYATKP